MGEEAVGENHQTYYLAPNTKWFRSSALIVHQFCFTSRRVGKRDVSRQSAPNISIENDETLVGIEQTLQQTYFRGSARCVQSFDDSLDFAIRMTYRISLRSSSLWEPRHPLLKVVWHFALSRRVFSRLLLCFIRDFTTHAIFYEWVQSINHTFLTILSQENHSVKSELMVFVKKVDRSWRGESRTRYYYHA